ncbi:MAG: 2-polyprenylphenol 6-hydroxylase [Zhengella sp.]|uniref:2-polyprenylphenol 6-hydroxylase n=1 Tax=Zhengella sp. TaxID=2282762 RepID=UPI001D680337|nr:2-polyprenylphenol 6-hydroxylase [Notoacmeibacter sp.]MCC0025860.1 2-polyprenylphenol 6-hydroxylase [Brucellaceae bacterium]
MSTIGAYFRLARAGWIMVREGVIAAAPGEHLEGLPRLGWQVARLLARRRVRERDRSERMSRALNRLGPSYVKLGQFMATRPDVVGREIALDLAHLQDRMDFFSGAAARKAVETSLGRAVEDVFSRFDPPIAAASIAQVHPAEIDDVNGLRKVAVKVIRPGVRERFAHDNEAFLLLSQLQERFIPATRRLRPVEVTRTLERSTRIEMDLRLEAAALSEMAANTQDDPGFRLPQVDWERTGRDVLTMEWIDGIKMSNIEALRASGHDLEKLAATIIQSFLRHALRDGFFHADMHPGNLFVDDAGHIVAVDLGIAGRIGKKERRFLAEILYGFITRDYRRVAEVHFEAGYVPEHHDVASFAQAIRAIGEPIHGQSAETISMAKLLTLLFEVTELFDMQTRPELLLLQKTMVVVEGVARELDPAFNMWKTAEPVVGEWIRANLGPRGMAEDAREGLGALVNLARQAPEFSRRAERLSRELDTMAENGLRFDEETARAIGKAEARHTRSGQIALWVIAACALWIAIQVT